MMFPMVWPEPRTSISAGTGPVCFFAQAGSASIASGFRAGGFPAKTTVPLMDEAADATLGQTDIATNPAASHTLFPVTRMLDSLVIANLVSADFADGHHRPSWGGRAALVPFRLRQKVSLD